MITFIIIIAVLLVCNGKVTIQVNQNYWLKIDFRDSIQLSPKRKGLSHWRGWDMVTISERYSVARKHSYKVVYHWLVFHVAFLKTENSEVGDIYPSGYTWKTDTEWQKKLQALTETGYFA